MIVRMALALCLVAGVAQADVMERVRSSGEIRLGHRADAPPFSFTDDDGAPAGLAVALCARAAEAVRRALGLDALRVRNVAVTAANRFEALTEGRIDLLCGPTTQTLARRQTLDFSIPYFIDGASVVFRAGPGAEIGALSGAPVGVLAGTTTEALLPGLLTAHGAVGATPISYRTHVEGLEALAMGEIAAYFGDQAILRYQLGRMRPAVPLQFAEEQFSFEPYALTMRRGETALRLEVDRALSETFESGAIYEMIEASLGEVTLSEIALAVFQVVTLPD
ncbi:amino acid ABC transporter substrate-binding protein [Pikeienuella piscinae]|uniref:Amino acid ABC transporter substrate-binding protein n=1 Tax=Pikeienuella piscinae TaxID=2748098 RepID=A0A7L5BUC6_9RHOB|nr:amino acid ABC transporter substrate-binding protein [Pikeienuella piscinae]QIE55202.1 amino acid ABC transporter substrate-binding protein [Pikeienuella piscinae]